MSRYITKKAEAKDKLQAATPPTDSPSHSGKEELREPIMGDLIDTFKRLIDFFHSSDLEWSIYDRMPSNGLVEAEFKAFHAQVKHAAFLERTNPLLLEALDALVRVTVEYQFAPKSYWQWTDPEHSDPQMRRKVLLAERMKLAKRLQSIRGELPSLAKTEAKPKTKVVKASPIIPSLASKFAKVPGSQRKWMALLRSEEIIDLENEFIPGHGQKSRILGAYEGAGRKLEFSVGNTSSAVALLNEAFHNLNISPARTQDLVGTNGHAVMLVRFQKASYT